MKVIRTIREFENFRQSLAHSNIYGLAPIERRTSDFPKSDSPKSKVQNPKSPLALVPTMGAFHAGHLSLMRKAREVAQVVAVSLFVNPTQFKVGEDFERYPRDEDRDFRLAEETGVDAIFAPTQEEMYPSTATTVHVSGLSDLWEGEFRPGHFDGVATVVAKLFNIVRPDAAAFGEKDYQQCRVIERMVEDLNFPVRLCIEPTVREPDGLAMSSRNAYLDAQQRSIAPKLYAELCSAAERINASRGGDARPHILSARANLQRVGFSIDYLALVDPTSLRPIDVARGRARLIAAGRLGATRLIDNIAV